MLDRAVVAAARVRRFPGAGKLRLAAAEVIQGPDLVPEDPAD